MDARTGALEVKMNKKIKYLYIYIDLTTLLFLFFNFYLVYIYILLNSVIGIVFLILNIKDYPENLISNKIKLIPILIVSLFMLWMGISFLHYKNIFWIGILLLFLCFSQPLWELEFFRDLDEYYDSFIKIYIGIIYPIKLFAIIYMLISTIVCV